MKKWMLALVAVVMTASFAHASSRSEMLAFVKANKMGFDAEYTKVKGFSHKIAKIEISKYPNLTKYLAKLEASKVSDWEDYVDEHGEEFSSNPKERAEARANPKEYLQAKFLVEIVNISEISNAEGEVIGYVIEADDHVQAAIYQDGAWMDLYFDTQFKLVKKQDWSS